MSGQTTVNVEFHAPPPDLQRYFTTFYLTEIIPSESPVVADALQPEWANLRIFSGQYPRCWIDGGDSLEDRRFVATGPSSRCTNFVIGATRFWGIGLLPLGWARFIGHPAEQHANLIADGDSHPSFAQFRPLAADLFADAPDPPAEFERICAFFRGLPPSPRLDEQRILAIHAAVVDPQIASVHELVEAVGMRQRTIERVCDQAFGFSPKLLLRRQRFMRSLAQFMLDPSLKWIGAMDGQYHDQAQFVRDFREFMGMSPREYAHQPHPVLERFMQERARIRGAAVQTMDQPRPAAGPAA